MAANSGIKKHNFYQEYEWQPDDFENMQSWIYDTIGAIAQGAFGKCVLSGMKVEPQSGLTVTVNTGIAVNEDGQLMVLGASDTVTFAQPLGNPAKSLLVARPLLTDDDDIPEPLNPSNNVPLTVIQGMELVAIDGTPAASPSYPATQAGDVVLMGFELDDAHVTIAVDDFDTGQRDEKKPRPKRVATQTADFTLDEENDNIIEVDATAADVTVTLPLAADALGKEFTVVKVDSSANLVIIEPQSPETLSGATSNDLSSQWNSMTFYSNGEDWRIL